MFGIRQPFMMDGWMHSLPFSYFLCQSNIHVVAVRFIAAMPAIKILLIISRCSLCWFTITSQSLHNSSTLFPFTSHHPCSEYLLRQPNLLPLIPSITSPLDLQDIHKNFHWIIKQISLKGQIFVNVKNIYCYFLCIRLVEFQ